MKRILIGVSLIILVLFLMVTGNVILDEYYPAIATPYLIVCCVAIIVIALMTDPRDPRVLIFDLFFRRW